MIRPILRYGEEPLHQRAENVSAITPVVKKLINDMIQTMYAASGIGLAALQVGVPLRILVADPSGVQNSKALIIMINPTLIDYGGSQLKEEGCLSVPGFNAIVPRAEHVVLKGLNLDGLEHSVRGTGLLARAFQHEMDHLNGTFFVDRLHGIKRDLIVRRIRKLQRIGKW